MGASKNLDLSEREYTINSTFKIQGKHLVPFEQEFRRNFNVVDYRVVPDTSYLYDNDVTFKKLVKKEQQARREKQDYINKHNN